jgi:hypothetical protein
LVNVNFSIYTEYQFLINDRFSLGSKLSFGTNLYSDWDQFRKYVWMGVGLELGFGKPRSLGTRKKSEGLLE